MELHGENAFKFRSYYTAYNNLRKWGTALDSMDETSIESIPGVGKAIAGKISELVNRGEMQTLNKYKAITPEGVQEMLEIKGLGPKKVEQIWKELGIETVGELLYACEENRLIEVKGFGQKAQESIRKSAQLFIDSMGFFHYSHVESIAMRFKDKLMQIFPNSNIEFVGLIGRKMEVLQSIEILIDRFLGEEDWEYIREFLDENTEDDVLYFGGIPIQIYETDTADFGSEQVLLTASEDFLAAFGSVSSAPTERQVFEDKGIPFIPGELRESKKIVEQIHNFDLHNLIEESDIKGVIHNHTTFSDGLNSLKEMCEHAKTLGYEYIVISDHSKSAFYANGMIEERIYQQWQEIDELNAQYGSTFRVFKGIESDILGNGDLDYDEAVLKGFDLVIASIHSNLKMELEKAMTRLLNAIENPYTRILGHPTGRLLLSRPGYPVDHTKIIDACAVNDVAIELNANPYRLDLDWRWIAYAMERGVKISINPDAHSCAGIQDIHFGVCVARKGGLTKAACLNTLDVGSIYDWMKIK